ncbi:hypothetical protein CBR67_02590 [Bordetella hinzii]|nr:hypothetical protein CBR67_02590 [Bordetella hinzii]
MPLARRPDKHGRLALNAGQLLEQIAQIVGPFDQPAAVRLPRSITVDNGPEFASRALDAWAYQAGVKLSFIRPGKPVENAYIESFSGKFRDECLNEHWFLSLSQAKSLIEDWRVEYNTERPHSAPGYLTPEQFALAHQQQRFFNSGLYVGTVLSLGAGHTGSLCQHPFCWQSVLLMCGFSRSAVSLKRRSFVMFPRACRFDQRIH